ncbi:MAG TPA: sugar phosphate isomerase/epimerase [Planctomycetota bacterium]|nr:sugar phosphate isomerase/epimerase [Planctomycetota bacterium]HRR79670.1 sugar phosphate isomerase/epimerase [Planctomycetota bacterium]HRT93678.1 sugar phosphate isomerase/epimerase [Planctomycetota bacterium]
MKLGLVTYNLAKDWDVPTILAMCEKTGFEGVELRTGHAHGVEVTLSPAQRAEVRQRFADSRVALAGLGSAFEYDAIDPAVVRQNIEGTKAYVNLAADVGAPGVKVRPNRLHEKEGVPKAKTLEQIGLALRECGQYAADCGVEIRLEVHGHETCLLPNIRAILDAADHDNVFVCWNSNLEDRDADGSIDASYALVRGKIRLAHITDLADERYPWRRLFALLAADGYRGFTLAEIGQPSLEPERFLRYYRALWLAYQPR